jgi:hypothetical protein
MAGDQPQRPSLWSTPIDPAERRARYRSLTALAAAFCGPRHQLVEVMRGAERGGEEAEAAALQCLADVPARTKRNLLSTFSAVTWPRVKPRIKETPR